MIWLRTNMYSSRIAKASSLVAALLMFTNTAHAQAAPQSKPAAVPAKPTAPGASKLDEALAHYNQGIALYSEGDYKLALIEFQRAYDLAPSWKLLYNIGEVQFQLNNYAAALAALETYLKDGGAEVPGKRKVEVEKDLDALRARVAHVTLQVNIADADVQLGDAATVRSPVAPNQLVDAGNLRIRVSKSGFQPYDRIVQLAGKDNQTVVVTLEEIKGKTDTLIVRDESRSYGWVLGWVGTAALAAGAIGTGIVSLNAGADLERAKKQANSTDTRNTLASRQKTFGIASDTMTVGAIIVGGISIYLTIRELGKSNSGPAPTKATARALQLPAPSLDVGLNYVGLRGQF
jgi:tetratricopeptide (TPR) repeat protein